MFCKKLISLFLAAVLTLSLCACGGEQPPASPASPSASENPAPEAPATILLTDNVGREVELPYPVEQIGRASCRERV